MWNAAQRGDVKDVGIHLKILWGAHRLGDSIYTKQFVKTAMRDALNVAVANHHMSTVRVLLKAKADVWGSHWDSCPMHSAVGSGALEIMGVMLRAQPPAWPSMWEDVVQFAAECDNAPGLMMLVRAKAPLEYAYDALPGGGTGIPPYATVFGTAVKRGSCSVVQALVRECGVDVNMKFKFNRTMVHVAMRQRQPRAKDMLQLLLELKADVNAADVWHVTPAMASCARRRTGCLRVLARAKAKFDPSALLCEMPTLHNARFVRLLLHLRADVNVQAPYGDPVILRAVLKQPPDVVELLTAAKADVNKAGTGGKLPVNAVMWRLSRPTNITDTARRLLVILLAAKADTNLRGARGNTAEDVARAARFPSVVAAAAAATTSPTAGW